METTANSTPAGDAERRNDFKGRADRCHDKCHGRPGPEINSPARHQLIALIARRTVNGPNGCRVWTGAGSKSSIHGRLKYRGELLAPHRLVLEHAIGRRLRRNEDACHRCDNPPCVNPGHLFAGSRRDNMVDASLKGRLGKPFMQYDVVKALVLEQRAGATHGQLAARFGIGSSAVAKILKGKTRFGALAIAEVGGKPYQHPRSPMKPLAKALPLLRRRCSAAVASSLREPRTLAARRHPA